MNHFNNNKIGSNYQPNSPVTRKRPFGEDIDTTQLYEYNNQPSKIPRLGNEEFSHYYGSTSQNMGVQSVGSQTQDYSRQDL